MNKLESTSIQKKVKEKYDKVFPGGDTLILGVSGGPDSMALLYLFHKSSIPVFVVHINYGLRDEESDSDQHLVEDVCAMWGIECCSVFLENEKVVGNLQDWARKMRYQIFRDLKKEINAAGIAIAHHQDDQLETMLFKILRGGGISSWKGLQMWDGEIFRPILDITKSEVLEFCDFEAIPFRIDASNETNDYTRNALRNTVFPVFDSFIPGWKSNLKAVGHKAEVTDEVLNKMLELVVENNSLLVDDLSELSLNLKASIVQKFVRNSADYALSKGEINAVVQLIESQTGKIVQLTDEITVVRNRDRLSIKKNGNEQFKEVFLSETDLKNEIKVSDWNLNIVMGYQNSDLIISLDEIQWPIKIRTWEAGDNIQPLGMIGSQKVSDHLTNRKINASQREETLILIDSGGTICAILYPITSVNGENGCISELVKITESTKKSLSISKT